MELDSKKKKAILSAFLLFFICIIMCKFYRGYIYKNHINDFHLADTLTSWFSVPSSSLFFWGITKRYKYNQCLIGVVLGFTLHELLFSLTFDFYDLAALWISSGIAFLIKNQIRVC